MQDGAHVRVMVLGIRGMPNVQGGVETHAEHLYSRLSEVGCDIEVIVRSRFVPAQQRSLGPVRLRRLWAPSQPGLESLVHSLLGVFLAGVSRPDILHIHAIGPAIVTPLARLMGLRVVVTHHGPDYDRDKWGPMARFVLRTGEFCGMRYSTARIAISRVIRELILAKHHRQSALIPNGVEEARLRVETTHLSRLGLQPGRYFLQVARIVPEKRQLDLIQAFSLAKQTGWQLVLVGSGDDGDYLRAVHAAAELHGVILTGFQSGEALGELYSHAGAFVLPSSHEGLPIALLEALSYGLSVVASNIPANLEVGLPESSYFELGDIQALATRLIAAVRNNADPEAREQRRRWVLNEYDWDTVAKQTLAVYQGMMGSRSSHQQSASR